MQYLIWFLLISYLLGFFIFAYETFYALKKEKYYLIKPGIIILILSPLTTWHGILHYVQVIWCKLWKRPLKFWI